MNPPITCHRWFIPVLLLTFLAGIGQSVAQDLPTAKPEDVGASAEKVAALSRFRQSLVDDGRMAGGVIMMARQGQVVHLEAIGMADREEGNTRWHS